MEYLYIFIVGGILSVIAQILIDKTKLTTANIFVIYVCSGVLLGAVGLYKPLVNLASAGATIPLTGFGYLLAEGIKKAVDENGLIGVLKGGFTASAAGVTAAILFAFLFAMIFKSKQK